MYPTCLPPCAIQTIDYKTDSPAEWIGAPPLARHSARASSSRSGRDLECRGHTDADILIALRHKKLWHSNGLYFNPESEIHGFEKT
jgi:hypothetical protein